MKRVILVWPFRVFLVLGLLAAGPTWAGDMQEEYKAEAKSETLTEMPLHGVDGKNVIVKRFSFPAGYVGKKHTHTGPVFVYVISGSLTVEVGGKKQSVKAGDLYVEPIEETMQAMNTSSSEPAEIVVFQVSDTGKPMMMKVKE